MIANLSENLSASLRELGHAGRMLFTTRMIRLFAYGFLSVILALYLDEIGLTRTQIGWLLSLILLGDTAVSLWITTHADRIGRRRMLLAGAGLMLLAGIVFAITRDFVVLLAAGIVGVISPSGNEVGPFLSIEQASLSHIVPDTRRTEIFAWYNLAGSFSTALGALCGGGLAGLLQNAGVDHILSYQVVIVGYALCGAIMAILFFRLPSSIEVQSDSPESVAPQQTIRDTRYATGDKPSAAPRPFLGLAESRGIVLRLSALFALDAFAGGLIVQTILSYWFHIRFGLEPEALGGIFFAANILAGISALSASAIAKRIGLINTMVFTHLPSNILLIGVPFMPTLPLAIGLLLVRFSISQMDVPTRQSYTMAVVSPAERSAASGVTGVARTIGAGLSPYLTGLFLTNPALLAAPFVLSGGLKIIYDLMLWASFRATKPPEEKTGAPG